MPFEQVHPAIHQAAWTAVGSIPGCSLDTIAFANASNMPNSHLRSMAVSLTGWSPSLHRVAMTWRIPMDMGPHRTRPDYEVHAEMLVRQMRRLMDVQRTRAAEGLALGSAVPLRADGGAPSPCDHLHADASVLALMIDRAQRQGDTPGDTIKGLIALPIASIHNNARDYDGGADLQGGDISTHEADGIRIVAPTWNVTEDRSMTAGSYASAYSSPVAPLPHRAGDPPVVTVGRSMVMVSGAVLPDTVIAAASGRLVGEVADIHPVLANRRIVKADAGDDWFALTMQPAPAPLGPLMNGGAFNALEILAPFHGGPEPTLHRMERA
jgi:hypothetical protein